MSQDGVSCELLPLDLDPNFQEKKVVRRLEARVNVEGWEAVWARGGFP